MLTTDYVPGTPNWLDLAARDVDAAASFYANLFGWTLQSLGEDAGGYGFFQLDGETVAAVGPLTEGAVPSWTLYFQTPDADATTDAVQQAGGRVRIPPMDVFTAGRLAGFTDPTGAEFAVWQPGDTKGLGTLMQPNALCWTELYTSDAATAKRFYTDVFAWESTEQPMGQDMTYTVVSAPGGGRGEDTGHGGIMELPREDVEQHGARSEWHPYFAVTDCDATFATATGNGATLLIPPTDVPGVGRLAMLRDPGGAQFALIRPEPMG